MICNTFVLDHREANIYKVKANEAMHAKRFLEVKLPFDFNPPDPSFITRLTSLTRRQLSCILWLYDWAKGGRFYTNILAIELLHIAGS